VVNRAIRDSTTSALGLRDAGRDALIVAALGERRSALACWRAWREAGGDPHRDPVAQRWLPLVGAHLEATDLSPDERTLFATAQRSVWAANTRLIDAAFEAAETLHASGLQTVVLKGAALALSVYDTHALRPIGDVDLMVRPRDAASARRILFDLGWRPLRSIRPDDLVWRHALDLTKAPHGAIDLHWYLLPENAWPSADVDLWHRVRPLPASSHLQMLGAADQLLHVCLHGLRWSPVHAAHWIADAKQILTRERDTIDWAVVVDESVRRRLALQMASALRLVSLSGRVPVPSAVVEALEAAPSTWRERLEARAKSRPVVSLGGVLATWCRWRRLCAAAGSGSPGWLRFLAAAVGVDSRRALGPWAFKHSKALVTQAFSGSRPRGASLTPEVTVRVVRS
jgi:hypothetical protein